MSRPLPNFIRPQPKFAPLTRRARRRLQLAAAGLALLLVAQVLLADGSRLAASASWRPWLERACGVAGCALPAWRQPSAFVVLNREIQPHPSNPQALLVTASFRNDAAWPQVWPQLELALTDLDGNRIGMRRFQAAEYLGGSPARATLAPGQSATLALEILDPGNRAIAFEFDFH